MNWRRAEALYVTTNWSNADLRQRDCAASGWYSPVGHATQTVLPTPGWCGPGSHAEHCSAALVVFRALLPRLPALQLTQRACPSLDWCCPAGHDWQCRDDIGSIAASPKRPGLHG